MEYKRPDVGLKIYREARFTEFSNLRLRVYTPYAHQNSNQSLNISNRKTNCLFSVKVFLFINVRVKLFFH